MDDDFYVLAKSYKEARDAVLLYGVKNYGSHAMDLAKTVWLAARNQFKYMLAMNDVMVKAEAQLRRDPKEKRIYEAMQQELITYEYANVTYPLTADTFWTIFTEPSLQVMLHYSVNSYTDSPITIRSPLAVAALKYEAATGEEK